MDRKLMAPPVVRGPTAIDLVTRSFLIHHCGDQLAQPHGSLLLALRRMLTPKLGSVEFDAKKQSLVVKDVAKVVQEVADILKHVDGSCYVFKTTK